VSPIVRISDAVFARLEKQVQGFDTPSGVIERLLNHYEGVEQTVEKEQTSPTAKQGRLFTNREIQQRIAEVARTLPESELAQLCDKVKSKRILDINFPIFVQVPVNSAPKTKRDAVKDKGMNRWTWKFEFERGGYQYAICTQWFEWNDSKVQAWLDKHENNS